MSIGGKKQVSLGDLMKVLNSFAWTLLMTVEPVHCSNPGTGEQAKLKSLKKHLFVTKCFAFSLDVWQIYNFVFPKRNHEQED